jgi:hypothetical protein
MRRRCFERDSEIEKRSARLLIGISRQALQCEKYALTKKAPACPIIAYQNLRKEKHIDPIKERRSC